MKRVSMLGLGYIGLPTAVCAAQHGYEVFGYDIDQGRVRAINACEPFSAEPGLEQALLHVLHEGSFRASIELYAADFFVVAVPTPFTTGHTPDLSYVCSAIDALARVLEHGNTVIIESTVPVGTTHLMAKLLEEKTKLTAGLDFYIAHCPERMLPGKIFEELIYNDRVIGGYTHDCAQSAAAFYDLFVEGSIYLTDHRTAEMVKLIENSSRDVAIAFANQVAAIAEAAQVDPFQVIHLANMHPRVKILDPGIGVGGHCIAVDPYFLISAYPQQTDLLAQARTINEQQPQNVITTIQESAQRIRHQTGLAKVQVALLGLAYKPDIEDLRESPALLIAQTVAKDADLQVIICEPNLRPEKIAGLGFDRVAGLWHAIADADIVVILVKHKEFVALRTYDFAHRVVIDPCGMLMRSSIIPYKRVVQRQGKMPFNGRLAGQPELGV